jgi:hypothetical protein
VESVPRPGARASWAALAALAAGVLLAVLWQTAWPRRLRPLPEPASWWACDRDAGALEGLDDALRPCARVPAPFPLRAVPSADGGAWLLCAPGPGPQAPHELWRIDAAARRVARHPLGTPLALAAGEDGSICVLEQPAAGRERIACLSSDAPPLVLAEIPAAVCLAQSRRRILVGLTDGQLVLLTRAGFLEFERAHEFACSEVAAAQAGWIALGAQRLAWLDERLAPRWSVEHGLARARLGVGDRAWIWIHAERGERVLRYDARGRLELDLQAPARSVRAVWGRADGSALVATDGALLCVTADGEWRLGQGGFDALVDVCAAR